MTHKTNLEGTVSNFILWILGQLKLHKKGWEGTDKNGTTAKHTWYGKEEEECSLFFLPKYLWKINNCSLAEEEEEGVILYEEAGLLSFLEKRLDGKELSLRTVGLDMKGLQNTYKKLKQGFYLAVAEEILNYYIFNDETLSNHEIFKVSTPKEILAARSLVIHAKSMILIGTTWDSPLKGTTIRARKQLAQ